MVNGAIDKTTRKTLLRTLLNNNQPHDTGAAMANLHGHYGKGHDHMCPPKGLKSKSSPVPLRSQGPDAAEKKEAECAHHRGWFGLSPQHRSPTLGSMANAALTDSFNLMCAAPHCQRTIDNRVAEDCMTQEALRQSAAGSAAGSAAELKVVVKDAVDVSACDAHIVEYDMFNTKADAVAVVREDDSDVEDTLQWGLFERCPTVDWKEKESNTAKKISEDIKELQKDGGSEPSTSLQT